MKERSPPNVDVEVEVVLTLEPQRADLLLIHRSGARLEEGRVMRRLWPMLSAHSLVEFKSISRPPRRGDWARLLGYAAQYHAPRMEELGASENLSLVMITAKMTPVLERDAQAMGWTIHDLGDGYHRVNGNNYPTFLVLLDDVSRSEQDPLLGAFGHRTLEPNDREACFWLLAHLSGVEDLKMSEMEGYQDFLERIRQAVPPEVLVTLLKPEERVAGLKPEERVAGLKPEERVAGLEPEVLAGFLKPEERTVGLTPDETVLLLANELLRMLPEDLLERLPERVRIEIRRRIGSES